MKFRVITSSLAVIACAGSLPSEEMPRLETLPVLSLSECPRLDVEQMGAVDVVFVIDASRSTLDPVGKDINQNGKVGRPVMSRVGGPFDLGSTDTGDSFLVAEVVATRSIVRALLNEEARFGIVSFAGGARPDSSDTTLVVGTPLSDHEAAFERILASGSDGNTDFASGIVAARRALAAAPHRNPAARRLALFMSDSPSSYPPSPKGSVSRFGEPAVRNAVVAARSNGVVFHSFALGDRAASEPGMLGVIAEMTGGKYRTVRDVSSLHCRLAESLAP